MTNKNKLLYTIYIMGTLTLHGCTIVDHQQYFEQHEKTFKAQTNYVTHTVQRDSYNIHVREFGAKTQQPTLVMLHGFPDSMHLYDRLVPELINERHIVAFDFIGWGDSDKPENHTYDSQGLKKDLEAVVTQLNLEQVVLVLHDASGPPGIDWALDNPDKIAGLVLLNTFYGPMPTLKPPEAIERFSTPGIYRDISVFVASNSDYFWIKGYTKQISKFISTPELREPLQKILGYQSLNIRPAFFSLNKVLLDEISERKNRITLLQSFARPVRIIFGNDDPYLNAGVAKEFHKILPESELFLIKDGGHFVQIDKPKQVAELLKQFPSINNLSQTD